MVGMAEIELDRETGVVEVLNYAASSTAVFPSIRHLRAFKPKGGIVQGIGHTLMEDVTRTPKGRIRESNLFTYRLPTRLDTGRIHVEFENSYEPTGPFGAKSIGEIVINTPAPRLRRQFTARRACGIASCPFCPSISCSRNPRSRHSKRVFAHPAENHGHHRKRREIEALRALAEELATEGAANAEFIVALKPTDKPQVGTSPNEDCPTRRPQVISRRLMAASRQPGAPPQKRTPSPKRRAAHTYQATSTKMLVPDWCPVLLDPAMDEVQLALSTHLSSAWGTSMSQRARSRRRARAWRFRSWKPRPTTCSLKPMEQKMLP